MTAKEHYDNHLGNFYSWMVGEFQQKQGEQQDFFTTANINPFKSRIAFDLGCGHGLQSISLAQLGFQIHAVDFNSQLLDELERHKGDLNITIHNSEIMEFLISSDSSADVIACMGDTITHFENIESVEQLISKSYERLEEGGWLVLSFRDLTSALQDEHRFLPVKSDMDRIHTCFLEYFPDHVRIYDLLHEWDGAQWKQSVSWYPKLRLSTSQVSDMLKQRGYKSVDTIVINRMNYLVAKK